MSFFKSHTVAVSDVEHPSMCQDVALLVITAPRLTFSRDD